MFVKNQVYENIGVHRLNDSPKKDRDYSIQSDGRVKGFVAGELHTLIKDVDLEDFDDVRVTTLAYYAAKWYNDNKADNVDKCHLYDLYSWLVEQKPSLELVFHDSRCSFINYYLNYCGAEEGDFVGAADLQNIKLELERLQIELDLREVTNQLPLVL